MQRRSYKILRLLEKYGIDPKRGGEIGVQFGKNANNLLKTFPNLHLILVDSYDREAVIHKNFTTEEVWEKAHKTLGRFEDRIQWLEITSVEAATWVEDRHLDFVFIDAMHTYEAVREDVESWLPKVRTGGLLMGHDFSSRFRGVKRAVIERFGKELQHVGDIWFVPITEEIRK